MRKFSLIAIACVTLALLSILAFPAFYNIALKKYREVAWEHAVGFVLETEEYCIPIRSAKGRRGAMTWYDPMECSDAQEFILSKKDAERYSTASTVKAKVVPASGYSFEAFSIYSLDYGVKLKPGLTLPIIVNPSDTTKLTVAINGEDFRQIKVGLFYALAILASAALFTIYFMYIT